MFEAETALASFTCSDFFPVAGLGWLVDWFSGQHKRLNDVYLKLDTLFQLVIDDHMNPGRTKDHEDIIDAMLDVIHKQGKNDSLKLTVDHIKGFLANIFLAGIDTGAITMIWAMTELAKKPKLMKKVQDEIRDCLGNNKETITEEDVDKVPYLKLVIKETFRLHPAAPLILPRETMSHMKVQGYDILPKTRILVNTWAIGRDPKLWTEPESITQVTRTSNLKSLKAYLIQQLDLQTHIHLLDFRRIIVKAKLRVGRRHNQTKKKDFFLLHKQCSKSLVPIVLEVNREDSLSHLHSYGYMIPALNSISGFPVN